MKVKGPDEHRTHPGPVFVGVLEGPRQIVGLLHLGYVHPAKVVFKDRYRMAPPKAIFGGVAQPAELGGPDGLGTQIIVLHNGVDHLRAAKSKAVTVVVLRELIQREFRWVGKASRVVAEGIKVISRPALEHLTGIQPLVHSTAIVA